MQSPSVTAAQTDENALLYHLNPIAAAPRSQLKSRSDVASLDDFRLSQISGVAKSLAAFHDAKWLPQLAAF